MRLFAADQCRGVSARRPSRDLAVTLASHQQPTSRASRQAQTATPTGQQGQHPFLRGLALLDQVMLQRMMLQRIFSIAEVEAPPQPSRPSAHEAYEQLLQTAHERTFDAPAGQLNGRAGRRCTLEDGERMLMRCIEMRPEDMRARVLLLRNIMLQNMGRERDVPVLALQTLQEAGVADCDVASPASVPVLQTVLLALKALHRMERSSAVPSFLDSAQQAVPGLAPNFANLARWLAATLDGLTDEERLVLLAKRSFLSCVDLQLVTGGTMQASSQKVDVGISWD